MIRIRELLKEIGGLSLHGHRNEGKWYGQEAELKDYEEFEELESLIEKNFKLLELYRKIYHISPMKNETKESYWARVEYLDNKIKELENE